MPSGNEMTGTRTAARFDQNRKFGIEIEAYNCDQHELAEAITAAGVGCAVEGYTHQTMSHWKIVSDGSIQGNDTFELVSPPLKGQAGLDEIEKVCRVLRAQGAKVNRSTGLHVHHDAAGLSVEAVKAVLTMWWKYEDVIQYFLPPSRRANTYCKPAFPRQSGGSTIQGYAWTPGSDPVQGWKSALDRIHRMNQLSGDGAGSIQGGSRYAPVNCQALARHGTLEFRSHGGTTEFDKIQAWIVFTQWFLTRSNERGCQIRTRMTGRWAEHTMFLWKAIDWINLDDPIVIKAKNTLSARFKFFKEQERAGAAVPTEPLAQMVGGRLRPTPAAGMQEPGER